MNLPNFEKTENFVVLIGSIIAAVDGLFVFMDWKPAHEILTTFLVGTAAVGSFTLLIRWHRQEHELLNKVNHSKEEILAAVQLSKHETLAAVDLSKLIVRGNEVAKHLGEVIKDYGDVRQKQYPDFTDNFLARELEIFRDKLHRLSGGAIYCDLDFGQTLAPNFFFAWEGKCFVTSYGPWKWWRDDHGTAQLEANRKRIREGKGSIIRYFVVCRQGDLPDDDIIDMHIDAKVDVRVIDEDRIEKKYRRDVGVFFNKDKVVFLSMWENGTHEGTPAIAKLLFGGEEFWLAQAIYHHFTSIGEAEQIPTRESWRRYKGKYLNA